ncbi:MAG: DegT/DnrJ/EryC1/StrS family aminotransferase, partial [Nanoarchaeota archaeon]|nr:DegT/DnrJ/EryC1/StrS family aminotransferase [Nanoarchaeota archaeon]
MGIISLLQKYTRHRNVVLFNNGSEAISEALRLIKRVNPKNKILIPDQGGWVGYDTYLFKKGYEVYKIKTNRGVIDLNVLRRNIPGSAAILISSFAGYYAEQPLAEIANICKQNQCLLVEDASGAIGDVKLCNGKFSDIIIGTFGEGKIVNCKNYGFLSSNFNLKAELFDEDEILHKKLKEAPARLNKLLKISENVKFDLQDYEVFHSNRRGINVIVGYDEDV